MDAGVIRRILKYARHMSKSKAEAAAQRIKTINSALEVKTHPRFLNAENGTELLRHSDVSVDCLDNLLTRIVLQRLCQLTCCVM